MFDLCLVMPTYSYFVINIIGNKAYIHMYSAHQYIIEYQGMKFDLFSIMQLRII